MVSDVIFGPPRTANEAPGALFALDAALATGDAAEAARQLDQFDDGLALASGELARGDSPFDAVVVALSDGAYELERGSSKPPATCRPSPRPRSPAPAGSLDGLLEAAAAIARDWPMEDPTPPAAAALRAALDAATTSLDLHDCGALAVATGQLGVALRQARRHRHCRHFLRGDRHHLPTHRGRPHR